MMVCVCVCVLSNDAVIGVYHDATYGFIAQASDGAEKAKLHKWASAFDDKNINLRLKNDTVVYVFGPKDDVLLVCVRRFEFISLPYVTAFVIVCVCV